MDNIDKHRPVSNREYQTESLNQLTYSKHYLKGREGRAPKSSRSIETSLKIAQNVLLAESNKLFLTKSKNLLVSDDIKHIDTTLEKAIPEVACGPNPRNEIDAIAYPYRMICLLLIHTSTELEPFRGTGFFISPKCIITAGHCVYTLGGWVSKIEVIPGGKGNHLPPFGSQSSTHFETTNGWIDDRDPSFDYAVIMLPNDTLYNNIKNCYFGYKIIPDGNPSLKLMISGYPEDKPLTQWKGEGPVDQYGFNKLTYRIDTEKGNSGSPVFIKNGNVYTVLGIHNYGECPNFCTRVTQSVTNNFQRWIDISNH